MNEDIKQLLLDIKNELKTDIRDLKDDIKREIIEELTTSEVQTVTPRKRSLAKAIKAAISKPSESGRCGYSSTNVCGGTSKCG